jgi:DNA-nicking Smr family endonuclease
VTDGEGENESIEAAIEMPIDGTLDLHTFDPRDVEDLVGDYLAACRERGILDVRIVHGKGRGVLRRRVQAVLGRTSGIERVTVGGAGGGSWGATLVRLRPAGEG